MIEPILRTADQPNSVRSGFGLRLRNLLLRKIWLPRSLYAAVPYLYIALGGYAIAGALYREHWSWIVPYLLLTGLICMQAGTAVLRMRGRGRRSLHAPKDDLSQ
jgi:hypothetical protein